MKSGYLYVLGHPSDPNLYKVGRTSRRPEERLAEHNSDHERYAGQIVKRTGQKWELKDYIFVADPIWAESVFWETAGFFLPLRQGIEVKRMDWGLVQAGLDAAKNAGVRPPQNPLPDYVYANTAWMKKRLAGRGISIVGNVRSKAFGKNNFRCDNGHEWRTVPSNVAEGEGCPQCGIGQRTSEEMRQAIKPGVLCLLIHPDKPGVVKIGLTYISLDQCRAENIWGDWEMHRYRNVEEPALAESLIWELLGHPIIPSDRGPISIGLSIAEAAFRDLNPRLQREIALAEKEKGIGD